jgi:metallo-beta-lactamase family protein
MLADAINSTRSAGGNIIIPSFAVERAHEVLFELNALLLKGMIKPITVYFDSPMATGITEVFRHHPELLDDETTELVRSGHSPFDFPGLKVTRNPAESAAIERSGQPHIVIAGSGMCTGGRIKRHLAANIARPESCILFVGYQAEGTLGREISEGKQEVRINGIFHPVRARIISFNNLSAHADREELMRWLGSLDAPPARLFVTHGEPAAARSFSETVAAGKGWPVTVPAWGDFVELK